jgi:hypothetical protein
MNLVAEAEVGGGQVKFLDDYGYGEQESSDKYFIAGLSVGTPLRLNRNVYFTPSLGYQYRKTTWDDNREVRNSFNLELKMDFFMGCGDDACDLSDNPVSISSRYQKGDMELGSNMIGNWQTGSQKTTYEGDGEYVEKGGFGNSSLSGYFLYYLLNNLAIGAGMDFSCDRTSSKDSDYKEKSGSVLFNPIVRYHVPVENMLKNLYGDGSIGIGTEFNKTDDGSGETKDNASVFRWRLGAGYNYFVAEHFSLNPMIGYGGQTNNNKDDDIKQSNNGLYAGIGWIYHIR